MTSIVVSSGVTSVGINLGAGDFMNVAGLAVDTTAAGGSIEIASSGTVSRTALEDGAVMVISSGGLAVSGTADLTSEIEVLSGASVSNFTVSGLLKLDRGGFADQILVGQGGTELINTVAVSGQVAAGGLQEIFFGGLDEFGSVAGVQRIFEGEASQEIGRASCRERVLVAV